MALQTCQFLGYFAPMTDEGHSADLIEPSWNLVRRLFEGTHRSSAWHDTGVWAVDRLEEHLGHSWACDVLAAGDALKSRIALAPAHTQAFASLLELAMRLELTVSLRGRPTLIKELKRDRRLARLVHTEIILEMVTVAGALGIGAATEVADMRNPVDVVFGWNESDVPVEAMALLTDDEFRQTDEATSQLRDAVLSVSIQIRAHVTLDLNSIPADQRAVCELIRILAEEANSRGGLARRSIEFGTVTVDVRDGFAPPTTSGPTISRDGWERTSLRLLTKARKDYSERSTWLRVDVLDGLWQFTQWAEVDLASKLSAIADKVRGDLADIDSVAGVVLSSGAIRAAGTHSDELARDVTTQAVGLRRLLPFYRVRETMIVPIQPDVGDETQLWTSVYDSEPEWLGDSLDRLGLPDASSILG